MHPGSALTTGSSCCRAHARPAILPPGFSVVSPRCGRWVPGSRLTVPSWPRHPGSRPSGAGSAWTFSDGTKTLFKTLEVRCLLPARVMLSSEPSHSSGTGQEGLRTKLEKADTDRPASSTVPVSSRAGRVCLLTGRGGAPGRTLSLRVSGFFLSVPDAACFSAGDRSPK